jgi:thymidylate synthase
MNNLDKTYTDLLQDILDNGVKKETRNGGTISVFGRQIRHKMSEGFPLLTTKKMAFKTMVVELLWFLRGDTNIKYLVDNDCHIWDGDAYKAYLKGWEHAKKLQKSFSTEERYQEYLSEIKILSQEEFINRIKTDEEFAEKYGELGKIYGKQWRSWEGYPEKWKTQDRYGNWMWQTTESGNTRHVDQIANLINDLKTNPDSRRLMVNAWNVGELDQMVLPPCHYGFQVYTRELSISELNILYNKRRGVGEVDTKYTIGTIVAKDPNIPTRAISLMWSQRSVDTGLGLSFNIASYGLLLMMIAKQVNMVPDELIGSLGDVHLYLNHIEPIKDQLTREPYPLPTVKLSNRIVYDISEYTLDDIILENYQSHPTIKMPLSN